MFTTSADPAWNNMAVTPLAVQLPFTPNYGWSQGAPLTTMVPIGPSTLITLPVSTMGAFVGLFQKWTTGQVIHTDMSGMYNTDRTATGHDWTTGQFASNGQTNAFGTTRKLQLVTPWSASIRKLGTGPFASVTAALPDFGFGGIAILNFDLQPAPEPTSAAMLAIGTAGLVGLGALRRRRS